MTENQFKEQFPQRVQILDLSPLQFESEFGRFTVYRYLEALIVFDPEDHEFYISARHSHNQRQNV